jgi:hypothetical protein
MSDIMMSSYFGSDIDGSADEQLSKYSPESSRAAIYVAASGDSAVTVQPLIAAVPVRDQTVAELAIRRLSKEIEFAKAELIELEQTVRQELYSPSVREWLLPLMAIGLALSFYGSFASANSAELGATGLMLLWSLSAFWFIYTREKRLEMAREANRAEIEIWSSRIEELQRSMEQNKRVVVPVYAGETDNS